MVYYFIMKMDCSIPCNLCGSTDIDELCLSDRHRNYLRTVICKKCGLVWTDPRPEDNQREYYSKKYRIDYKGTYKPKLKHVYRAGKVAIDRYEGLKEFLSQGDAVLDVGSGGGEFIYVLDALGYDAKGIEPNEGYAIYSRNELGLDIYNNFIQDVELPENAFRLITMYHVLEHMEDPFSILSKSNKYIREDGFLLIEVPNVEATCQSPMHRFHKAHLYNFNSVTLESLGKKAGYKVYKTTLSSDGGNITMIFKKAASIEGAPSVIGGNYEKIKSIIGKHTSISHYFSHYPYSRVLKKTFKYLDEMIMTRKFSRRKEIHDYLLCHAGLLNKECL